MQDACSRRVAHRTTASVPILVAAARAVLDDEWLAEPLREPGSDAARAMMSGAPPGAVGDDDAHRPRRIGCARAIRETAGSAAAPAARCRKLPAGKFHGEHPCVTGAAASSETTAVMSRPRAGA